MVYYLKVLYHTCLFMHECPRMACMINIHASNIPHQNIIGYPSISGLETQSLKIVFYHWIIGICYLCHIKVPNMHEYLKPSHYP